MVTLCVLRYAVTEQHRLPDPVAELARDVRDEQDFGSIGEAIRYMINEEGYNV